MAKRIALLSSPAGNGNLGDEVLVASVVQNIRHFYPDASIAVYCSNPEDVRNRHGIEAYPVGPSDWNPSRRAAGGDPKDSIGREKDGLLEKFKRYLKKIPLVYPTLKSAGWFTSAAINTKRELVFFANAYKEFRGTDLLIIAGSGVLSDHFGGAANFPWTIFAWTKIAKTSGAKVAFLSCGAGPLKSKISRHLIRNSLALADYRSFRDEGSKRLIEEIGLKGDNPVFPDLAHSLRIDNMKIYLEGWNTSQPLVGINAFPHGDKRYWPESDSSIYREYIHKLASFASWLLAHDYRICFFPTQLRSDPLVIEDIKEIMVRKSGNSSEEGIVEASISGIEDLLTQISGMDLVVATRFHGILLSFMLNKPVLAISNHPKMDHLMIDMGQGEYLLNIRDFQLDSLIERFLALQVRSAIIKQDIERFIVQNRNALESQYKTVFGLLN